MPPLPRFDTDLRGILVPLLCAGLLAVWLTQVADQPLMARRGYVFAIGPLFLLAGLHARLHAYLHDPARVNLAPLPVAPKRHWRAGRRTHIVGLVWTGFVGLAGITLGCLGGQVPTRDLFALAGDFGLLWIHAFLVEPLIPASCAYLGRRFPEASAVGNSQRYLSGGWSAPEIAVYLYAPALGLALAAALAMPGQLSLAQLDAGKPLAAIHIQLLVIPLVVSLGLRATANIVYTRGFFEAVARLHESIRTLAGPPLARKVPGWLAALGHRFDPPSRAVATLTARLTPAVTLRFLLPIGWALWATQTQPSAAMWALGGITAGLWSIPFSRVRKGLTNFAGATAGLPLSTRAWRRAEFLLWCLCLLPPLLATGIVAISMTLR